MKKPLLLFLSVVALCARAADDQAASSLPTPPKADETNLASPGVDALPNPVLVTQNTAAVAAPMSSSLPSAPASGGTVPADAANDLSTTSEAPLTQKQIYRLQQQEALRRQQAAYKANQSLYEGEKNEVAENYIKSRELYVFAASTYASIGQTNTPLYTRASEGLARVDLKLYDLATQEGDTNRAKELLEEASQYAPDNQVVATKLVRLNKALADPADTSILGNPAITPEFVKQVTQTEHLLAEAEQYRRTGQWDLATERLNQILGIDPYNKAAIGELERINKEKGKYYDEARLMTRNERLRQVEEAWYVPIKNENDQDTGTQENQNELTRASDFSIEQKLKSILINLNLPDVSLTEAVSVLHSESKRLDPAGVGVYFIAQPDAVNTAKRIHFSLNTPIPLRDALRYICQLAGVKYKVEDYGISIIPYSTSSLDLNTRTYTVQPGFFTQPSTPPSGSDASGGETPGRPLPAVTGLVAATDTSSPDSVISILKDRGINFDAPGSTAFYDPTNQQLRVTNTVDQLEFVEALVSADNAPTLMVRVSTKFVEINQSDLDDLTFNISQNILNGTGGSFTGTNVPTNQFGNLVNLPTGFTTLQGAGAITPNSVTALITGQTTTNENFLLLKSNIGPVKFAELMSALSQKQSTDMLSQPAAMVKNGEQATMEDDRIFIYPSAFQAPTTAQVPVTTGGNGNVPSTPPAVIPSFPSEFKEKPVGVKLVVRPQISPDNKSVSVSLLPEIINFDGFINYGSPINIGLSDAAGDYLGSINLSPNVVDQPVFDTRRINTKILVRDGFTVVMGGLLREDHQDVTEKVPLFGDLPFVGRLFQSKAKQSIKRNLLIFVTANIYRNNGELLNPPEAVDVSSLLGGNTGSVPPLQAQ